MHKRFNFGGDSLLLKYCQSKNNQVLSVKNLLKFYYKKLKQVKIL